MRLLLLILLWCCASLPCYTQSDDCNQLGVWLWFIEGTSYPSFVNMANDLNDLGVKRVYLKVADGTVDTTFWPELVNEDIVQILEAKGIEPWAWSFNYPGNEEAQAEALKIAAMTGYHGYVIDIESDFDGLTAPLQNLANAFYNARQHVLSEGIVTDSFPIHVTTWGNPQDHNFHIELLDPYVDAYMPQTYLENWGPSYLEDPAFWVEFGNEEYRQLGATKPIHHIISMEHGEVTADQVNTFFEASGSASSIWRIPGGGTPLSIREVWDQVDWNMNFCTSTADEDIYAITPSVYPNPTKSSIQLKGHNEYKNYEIIDLFGRVKMSGKCQDEISLQNLPKGVYTIRLSTANKTWSEPVIKI